MRRRTAWPTNEDPGVSGRPLQRWAVVAACPAAYRPGGSGTNGQLATLDRCGSPKIRLEPATANASSALIYDFGVATRVFRCYS